MNPDEKTVPESEQAQAGGKYTFTKKISKYHFIAVVVSFHKHLAVSSPTCRHFKMTN